MASPAATTTLANKPRTRVLLMVSSMQGGGSERQTLLLARHLDRDRFEPHLYLTHAVGDFLADVPDDVPIHSFDTLPETTGFYYPGKALRRQVRHAANLITDLNIDVVYDRTFHMTMIAGPATQQVNRARAASKQLPVRRVSTIVSPPHLAVPLVENRFVWLKRRRLAMAYRQSDVVVAVSEIAAHSAKQYYGLNDQRVVVVRNPVDANTLKSRKHLACSEEANSDCTRFVCVGRMTIEKGHVDLIDALALAESKWPASRPPWRLQLVGDGPLNSELRERVHELGWQDRVTFCGTVKNAAEEIAQADALILPSRFEGLPNVVLESMSIGTPVIATRAGGTTELQGDRPTAFWAQPSEPASLAREILEFALEPQRAWEHVAEARQWVETEHDLMTTIQKIESLMSRQ